MHFLILGVKWGFWAITLVQDTLEFKQGLYRRGRLSIFHKKVQPKFRPIGLASKAHQSWSKKQKHPTLRARPRRTPHANQKLLFNQTKKTCCIRRGLEQLSSYSGWRVITKKARANLLARAVVKGVDRRSTVYSWLLSDAKTPVWFSRWSLCGQGVVLKRFWMENVAR